MTGRPREKTATACLRCKRTGMSRYPRGLCGTCYDRVKASGHLADYAPQRTDRRSTVAALVADGCSTPKQVADRLGISRNAAFMALSKLRREGFAVGIDTPTPAWLVPIDAAPTATPCVGKTMDFDGLTPRELTPQRNPDVAAGLALCASCPLATRQWCLDVMQPRTLGNEWQGIAGGIVWSHGRVVYMAAESVEAAS